jgi:hypothetical protein
LACGNLESISFDSADQNGSGRAYKAIVNAGPYDKRKDFTEIKTGDKYVVAIEAVTVARNSTETRYYTTCTTSHPLKFRVRLANFKSNSAIGGYDDADFNQASTSEKNKVLFSTVFSANTALDNGFYSGSSIVTMSEGMTTTDFLKEKF